MKESELHTNYRSKFGKEAVDESGNFTIGYVQYLQDILTGDKQVIINLGKESVEITCVNVSLIETLGALRYMEKRVWLGMVNEKLKEPTPPL